MSKPDRRIWILSPVLIRILPAVALAILVAALPLGAQSAVKRSGRESVPSEDRGDAVPCATSETARQPEGAAGETDQNTDQSGSAVGSSTNDCISAAWGSDIAERSGHAPAGVLPVATTAPKPAGDPEPAPAAPAGTASTASPAAAAAAPPVTKPEATSNAVRKLTFKPGFREQVAYTHDEKGRQRLFNRRLRLKGGGNLASLAKYYVEVKIDNLGQFENEPKALVENAWLEFPLLPHLNIRTGLYDVPFSRNALTSDSKLLLMDRSLIKDAITSLGMADNTVGVLGHGRPFGGHFEYSVGLFNNFKFKKLNNPDDKKAGQFMPAGRVAFHLLEPASPDGYADYRSSYLGQGRRLTIGANTVHLNDAIDGLREFNLHAYGTDLFFNDGRFTFEAEYDRFIQSMKGGLDDVTGHGWYTQAGYMLTSKLEAVARHQQLDANLSITGNKLKWTSLGFNYYFHEHHIKVQSEYTFRDEQNDRVQLQLQFDY